MTRFIKVILGVFLFTAIFSLALFWKTEIIIAGGVCTRQCSSNDDCSNYRCECPGESKSYYCDKNELPPACTPEDNIKGVCHESCLCPEQCGEAGNPSCVWGDWGTCNGGYQARFCTCGTVYQIRSCTPGGGTVGYSLGIRLFADLNGNGVIDSFEQVGTGTDSSWAHGQSWASNLLWWDGDPLPGMGGQHMAYLPVDNNNYHITSSILSSTLHGLCNDRTYFPVNKLNGVDAPITINFFDPFAGTFTYHSYPGDASCTPSGACNCGPVWNVGVGWSHTSSTYPFIIKPKDGENWRILNIITCTGNGQPRCELEPDGSVHTYNLSDGASTAMDLFISTNNPTPTPQPAVGWWQVKDSDVQSAGDLTSSVPASNYFDILGVGGFPGIPAYGGSTNLTGANVSPTGWLVNSAVTNSKIYNYDYFANQIPNEITIGMNSVDTSDVAESLTSVSAIHDTNNYYWYKYDGALNGNQPLTIPAIDFGTRKVILMVDNADINITGNINLTTGTGFFMVIVKGNIVVDPGVGGGGNHNLAGLYFADGTFSDAILSSGTDKQLWVRGSVVANSGVNLQRDLGATENATTPSELFVYAPDQIMLFPKVFGSRRINWKEVAP